MNVQGGVYDTLQMNQPYKHEESCWFLKAFEAPFLRVGLRGGREKDSPEKEGRSFRKEKITYRELKDLRAQPELQQAFV